MNHEERINALLLSEVPDRTPVSFWRHFFHKESTAEGLAEAMLSFQNEFDWDFMKVNPRASYHIEVWKAELEFSGDEFIKPRIARYPVKNSFDWDRINPQKPDNPAFAEQLQALNLISRGLGGKVYFVQTVFSPLSIAGDLVNEPWELINEMKRNPKRIHSALANITDSLVLYCSEILNTGASGIFFATTEWATRNTISEELYHEFGIPYDLRVLKSVQEAEFNILHVCKPNNMLPLFVDYPFDILSYADSDEGNMSFKEVNQLFPGKIILGGIGAKTTLLNGSMEDVIREAENKAGQIPANGWILGPGCTIPAEVPRENLKALKKWASTRLNN